MSPQDAEEKLKSVVPAGQIQPPATVPADDDEYEYVEVDAAEVAPDEEEYEYVEVDAAEADDDDEYEYVEVDAAEADDDDEYEYVEVDADEADDDDEYEYVEVDADEADDEDEYEYVEVDADEAEAEETAAAAEPTPAVFDPAGGDKAAALTAAAAAAATAGADSSSGQDKDKPRSFLRRLIFEEPPKDGKSEEEKTPEERKKEKNDRIRRNLRMVALVVACYYFISAGYTWWEESKAENNPAAAAVQMQPLSNSQLFRERFNASLNEQRSSLPTANANDSSSGFIAVLSPAIELRGVLNEADGSVQYMQLQTRYPDALPPESLTALRAFVSACEDNSDPAYADRILSELGIEPEPDANEAGKVFEEVQVQSEKVHYTLSFSADAIDELTLRARAR